MTAERIGIASWIALIALQPLWYLLVAPPESGSRWFALVLMLPALLLPMFALTRGIGRVLFWAGVVALFYFCHGVVAAWIAPAARAPALVECALCVMLIGSLGLRRNLKTIA